MYNEANTIKEINKSCQSYFVDSKFYFKQSGFNSFVISGDYCTKARNNYKNSSEEINVVKWFDDFWIYSEVRFETSISKAINTFFSLSIFHGTNGDEIKRQLFRAEWDNFDNAETHPQPHWHIYSNHNIEKLFDNFSDMIEDENGFINMLKEENYKEIDLNRIHFAMNAQWGSNGSHIHRIDEGKTIIYWIQGLLGHIKSQLEYLKQ